MTDQMRDKARAVVLAYQRLSQLAKEAEICFDRPAPNRSQELRQAEANDTYVACAAAAVEFKRLIGVAEEQARLDQLSDEHFESLAEMHRLADAALAAIG